MLEQQSMPASLIRGQHLQAADMALKLFINAKVKLGRMSDVTLPPSSPSIEYNSASIQITQVSISVNIVPVAAKDFLLSGGMD